MIKPMIATPECMACHANQNVGDVIGVMDLTFSLEETDKKNSITFSRDIFYISCFRITYNYSNIFIVKKLQTL